MSHDLTAQPMRLPPPTKHQLALMIWLAVFPTLTVLNLALGGSLSELPVVLRTFVLATIAVPVSRRTPSRARRRSGGRSPARRWPPATAR